MEELEQFVLRAVEHGCYEPRQARLLLVAAKKLWSLVPDKRLSELPAQRGALAADASLSASSISTYKSRLKRLFEDFAKWHDGDLSQWRVQQSAQAARQASAVQPEHAPIGGAVLPIRLSSSIGELRLPRVLNGEDVDAVERQLGAIVNFLRSQL